MLTWREDGPNSNMADKLAIARVREGLTQAENVIIDDGWINEAVEMARLAGKENNPQFVIRILKSSLAKGRMP